MSQQTQLPAHKTKIVCTIGPASESPGVLESMIKAGMNVARINFSHGDFDSHRRVIQRVRQAADSVGRRVAIMADLPGPKIRIGDLEEEGAELVAGDELTLTTETILGSARRVSVSLAELATVAKAGDTLFINDGFIQLQVIDVQGGEVRCTVVVGGELRSRKGLNLPGMDLGISAFTLRDQECLAFAMEQGVDAVSQSFVTCEEDILAVKEAAKALGRRPLIIAKIERAGALEHIDGILSVADGIMVARGDLGVEIPIERMAVVQKDLMARANLHGKPVITATHMLESMVHHRRPTRAEATDVANAILDGTDCVMLSGESAMGRYPVDSVRMLASIAEATECRCVYPQVKEALRARRRADEVDMRDILAQSVLATLDRVSAAAVFIPTASGATARNVARFRLPVWITGVSPDDATCQRLQFTYGVFPWHMEEEPDRWNDFVREWLERAGIGPGLVVLTSGPSKKNPAGNHRMEVLDLRR